MRLNLMKSERKKNSKVAARCNMACPACGANAVLLLSPRYDGPDGYAMILWRLSCTKCRTDSREMTIMVQSQDRSTISIEGATDAILAMMNCIWESTLSGRSEETNEAAESEKRQYEKKGGILQ